MSRCQKVLWLLAIFLWSFAFPTERSKKNITTKEAKLSSSRIMDNNEIDLNRDDYPWRYHYDSALLFASQFMLSFVGVTFPWESIMRWKFLDGTWIVKWAQNCMETPVTELYCRVRSKRKRWFTIVTQFSLFFVIENFLWKYLKDKLARIQRRPQQWPTSAPTWTWLTARRKKVCTNSCRCRSIGGI